MRNSTLKYIAQEQVSYFFVLWKALGELKRKHISILYKNLLISSICSTVEEWEVIDNTKLSEVLICK